MEDKTAIEILKQLLSKYPLSDEEKEAVRTAIGILGWSTLAQGKIKGLKSARDARNTRDGE